MNLDDLKYFLALARELTMSAAGKKLHVKHSTVTRRIASLEDELGTRLFDRSPEGYFLTQTGENLLAYAEKIEDLSIEALRDLKGGDLKLEGTLKVTAPYDFFCTVIAPRLHEFTEDYPEIDLELLCSSEMLNLATLEADIAVRITEVPPDNLIGRKLLPLQQGVYGSKHYLQNRPAIEQLILWHSERNLPTWAKDHFPNGKVVARTDEAETMRAMATNHMGLAQLPCYVAEAETTLYRLDLTLKPPAWGIWILNHPDLRSTARVRVCKEFITSLIMDKSDLIQGETSKYDSQA